jgi:hypothetical protein
MNIVEKYLKDLVKDLPEHKKHAIASSLEEIVETHCSSLPMECKGKDCRFARKCPLFQEDIHPMGMPCPIEKMIIEYLILSYGRDLNVDTQNFVEMSMLADMVEAELYDRRTSGDISIGDFFDHQAVGIDPKGNPIMRKEESVSSLIKAKLKQRKDSIRAQFLATREAKAKYKIRETKDYTQIAAEARAMIEMQQKGYLPEAGRLLDIEEDNDRYIGETEAPGGSPPKVEEAS